MKIKRKMRKSMIAKRQENLRKNLLKNRERL